MSFNDYRPIILFDKGVLPEYVDLEESSWHVIQPNAGKCLDGSDWFFGARTGSKNGVYDEDIHIFFMGGGCCWTEDNSHQCSTKIPLSADDSRLGILLNYFLHGLLSEDSRNAFKDYTLVLVPYCSGDLYIGTPNGNSGLNHNGANMTFTVLDWVGEVFPGAKNVLISGESAGAMAAVAYASIIRSIFSEATNVTYFSDSALYPEFDFEVLVEAWGKDDRLSAIYSCWDDEYSGVDWFYCAVSNNAIPGIFFTYTNDDIQQEYDSMWGNSDDWQCQTVGLLEHLANCSNASVGYYAIPGIGHGVSNSSAFFSLNVDGVSPHDFVLDAVNRKVCCYKNFSSEILGSCEHEVSNLTGVCSFNEEQSAGTGEAKYYVPYIFAGLSTLSIIFFFALRSLYKSRKSKGFKRQLNQAERTTLDLVSTDKYGSIKDI